MRFALLQMAEYVNMMTVAAVGASLFFGGWLAPLPALQHVGGHDIGLLAWAFDVLDSVISDWRYTPTSLDGFQCGDFDNGAGSLLKSRMPGWVPHPSECETGLSDEGVVAVAVDVPRDGTYRLWSRVMPPAPGGGRSLLQVDDGCPTPAWSSPGPAGVWSWQTAVDGLSLTAGRHTLRFLGAVPPMPLR